MKRTFGGLLHDRRGASSIEYALLVIAIMVVSAMAFRALQDRVIRAARDPGEPGGGVAANGAGPGGGGGSYGGGGGSYGGGGGSGSFGGGSYGGGGGSFGGGGFGSGKPTGVVGSGGSIITGNGGSGGSGSNGGNNGSCAGGTCGNPDSNCFVAGTKVATPSGERSIEELVPGDVVLARGESDDAVSARPVLQTFVRGTSSLVDVRIEGLDGYRESIRSTSEHPYWTLDRGWVAAGELLANEPLLDSSGREVRVTKVASLPLEAVVYNVEVDIDHTYFVGHTAVWVHNQCGTRGVNGAPAPSAGSSKSGGGSSKKRPAPDDDDDDEKDGKAKRPKFWKDTENKVVASAEKDNNGTPTCPTCGTSIDPKDKIPLTKKDGSPQLKKDGTQKERRPYDIDHTYAPGVTTPDTKNGTWAQRQEEIDKYVKKQEQDGKPLTEKQIKDLKNDAYNSNVRFQCPSCNISHQYEDHTNYKPGVVTSGSKKGGKKR